MPNNAYSVKQLSVDSILGLVRDGVIATGSQRPFVWEPTRCAI
jgi:hypothetical protein